ncbi:MAG: EamA family transporter [Steroidobacteraceae bacterium]
MESLDGNTRLARAGLAQRIPPQVFFLGSAIFHYLGPSFAVLLFAHVSVPGVAWLRIASAALVFAVWRRPWRSLIGSTSSTKWTIGALGAVFALMNYSFYVAIDRLPLGTVAAIEFVGPILLALAGSRNARNFSALIAAVTGVYLLIDVRIAGDPVAFVWAFLNAALFVLYIVLAHSIANADIRVSAIDRLAAAMLVAAIVVTPIGFVGAIPALLDPVALLAGIGVGVSSSVIPYVFDQLAMARLPRATYALFVAILPATAVVMGVLVLHQVPSAIELLGVALVAVGVAVHRPAA